jgi:hypothetical protein
MPAYQIILFYVQAAEEGHVSAPKKNALSIPGQIKLLYKSARQSNPDFLLTILTTADTPLHGLDFEYERMDFEIDRRALMRERNRVQLAYIEASAARLIPFVFLDTDILLNIDPLVLFQKPFDIGLTWRDNNDMPINGGVVLVRNSRPDASMAFYRHLYENQLNDPLELAHWFGEQRSMAKIVNLTPEQLRNTSEMFKEGVRYRFFSCDTHNYTPRCLGVFGRKKILSPALYHFKGSTARFMGEFWTYHLDKNSDRIAFRHVRLMALRMKLRIQRIWEKARR